MEHVTSADGTRIAFWRSGSGPPLLLVHGTTADHTRWARVAPEFERHHTVFTMDRRGRGGSGDAAGYGIAREAEDVLSVLERIDAPVDLLGHSFGAICCLEGARLANNVRRLVLYEPPVPVGVDLVSPELVRRIEEMVERNAREEALVLFFREVVRVPPEQLATMRTLDAWTARVAGAHTLPREMQVDRLWHFEAEQFRTLQIPTLLLLGGESPPIFRQATELVDVALPDSRIVILAGQQHVAMDTAPALFTKEVLRFLHASG